MFPGRGTICFPRFWGSKEEAEGQKLHLSMYIQPHPCAGRILLGPEHSQGISPAPTGPCSQARSCCCHLPRLYQLQGVSGEAEASALPWCLPGELSDVHTLPAQSSIQTWIRGSHSGSGFLTAVTLVEEVLQFQRERAGGSLSSHGALPPGWHCRSSGNFSQMFTSNPESKETNR